MEKITRNNVAKLAGVSPSTVSRVFSKNKSISKETIQKVKKIAKKIGYTPSEIGKIFSHNKSFRIAVIIPFKYNQNKPSTIAYEYFSKTLLGIIEECGKHKYSVGMIADNNLTEQDLMKLTNSKSYDGFIFLVPSIDDTRFETLYKNKIPFIFVNHYIKNMPYPYVDCDSYLGMKDAFKYLQNKKIKKVTMLSAGKKSINSLDREKIFKKLSKQYKFKITKIVEGNFSKTSGYIKADEFLLDERPEVIFCANDRMAFGVITRLKEQKINIPDEIKIIGFDNQDLSTLIQPKLTTIENPFFDIGKQAGINLIKIISNKKFENVKMKTKLIIRESC